MSRRYMGSKSTDLSRKESVRLTYYWATATSNLSRDILSIDLLTKNPCNRFSDFWRFNSDYLLST